MRAWLVQTGEPVPLSSDVKRMRTALLADELSSRGHDVVWWASRFDHGSKRFVSASESPCRMDSGAELRLLPALGYRHNLSLRRYRDHVYVARRFRRAISADPNPPDLVVAATPDYHIASVAAEHARSLGIPYVIDVRDPWPDSFVDHAPGAIAKALARGLLAHDFAKVRRMLRGSAGIVAMMESMLDWGLAHAGRPRGERDRVFYLGTEPLPAPDPDFLGHLRGLGFGKRPVLVYVGTFGRYNHPGVIIEALRIMGERGDRAFDVVIGGAGDLFDALRNRAEGLERVHFTGWLRSEQIAAVLALGSLGVVPWTQGDAFPNKAFSYLAAGLPMVTSAGGDLRTILEGERIGAFFPPGDALALADRLTKMIAEQSELDAMRFRIAALYPLHFEASGIYRAFADHLEALQRVGRTEA